MMVQMNLQYKEVAVKLVYYGPAMSGKTTNLQQLHKIFNPETRGRLMSLETQNDRTLFFDLLPIQYKTPSGLSVKLKLYTVPGQVIHNSTRKAVLAGADAVSFIADSQKSQALSNSISFKNLKENLKLNGLDFDKLPIVVQFNKRDLDNIKPEDEIRRDWGSSRFPTFVASAIKGEGVYETFEVILRQAFDALDRDYGFYKKFGFEMEPFLKHIFPEVNRPSTPRKSLIGGGTPG